MDDTISRQAAIEALDEPCKVPESWTDEYAVGERAQYEKDVKALNSLPSAERRGRLDEMGVLIKGMEMPKDCPMCLMAHFNKLDRLTGCDAAPGKRYVDKGEEEYWRSDKRPSWCPLIPVAYGEMEE